MESAAAKSFPSKGRFYSVSKIALLAGLNGAGLVALPHDALAACVNSGGSNYICSGAETSPQSVVAPNANVSTSPGFAVDTSSGNALTISGAGDIGYTDVNYTRLSTTSSVPGNDAGLVITAGNVATVWTNGDIASYGTGIEINAAAAHVTMGGSILSSNGQGVAVVTSAGGAAVSVGGEINSAATGIAASVLAPGASTIIDLTIDAGKVIGTGYVGIDASNNGAGATRIAATGDVLGGNYGVRVFNSSTATDLTTGVAKATGGLSGILAENRGTGVTVVTATGDVTGSQNYGVLAVNGAVTLDADGRLSAVANSSATDLTVEVARTTGGDVGVYARNQGTGATRVTSVGNVYGGQVGIYGFAGSTATTLTINGGPSTAGGLTGIHAENRGKGATVVTATGNVTGTQNYGVLAVNGLATLDAGGRVAGVSGSGGTDLQVGIGGDATGGLAGVHASNRGSGQTSVSVVGVASGGDYGVVAQNASSATNLTIIASTTTGGLTGLAAINQGSGATRVTATGDVTGTQNYGILAVNGLVGLDGNGVYAGGSSGASGDLTVVATNVTGGLAGIYVDNKGGSGGASTSVSASGLVVGTVGDGIVAQSSANGDLRIDVAGVEGNRNGIAAQNLGTGSAILTAADAVNGALGTGIDAYAADGDVSINAAAVNGGVDGIVARNDGAGSTSVVATGGVSGATGYGIIALTGGNNVTVSASQVFGEVTGIHAGNEGVGSTRVTTTGEVYGASAGIDVRNGATAQDIVIETAQVAGGVMGVHADNAGVGSTRVTATGQAYGAVAGIYAHNGTTAQDIVIETAQVAGGVTGVYADNEGAGSTRVTATGEAYGAAAGIYAHNGATAQDIIIETAKVSGGVTGVHADNEGAGSTRVTATGEAYGAAAGVYAHNGATAQDIIIDTAKVAGGVTGIHADNEGMGSTRVSAKDEAYGATYGIYAINRSAAANLTVEAAKVTGGDVGIYAVNDGLGATKVTATGIVSGGSYGVYATNGATASALTVAVGDVSGTRAGIYAANAGSGPTDIVVNGNASGGEQAIFVSSAGQPITLVTKAFTGNQSGQSDSLAIAGAGGPITYTNQGDLVGVVNFAAGAHVMVNEGIWNTAGGTNALGGSAQLVNSGVLVAAAGAAVGESTVLNGLASFTNRGIVTLVDGGAGDVMRQNGGNASFAAGSVLAIDMDAAGGADRFITSGAATISGTTLTVNAIGRMAPYGTRTTVVTAEGGLEGRFATVTGLPANTAFLTLAEAYDTTSAYFDVVQYRTFSAAALTPNQKGTAYGLETMARSGPLFDAVVNLASDAQARAAFDQLSGEIHTSARLAMIEDSHFMRDGVLGRLRNVAGAPGSAPVPVMSFAPGGPTILAGAEPEVLSVWGQSYGSWGQTKGDGNAAPFNRSSGGMTAGIDTPALGLESLPLRVGLIGGYSRSNISAGARNGSGVSENYHLGLYAGAELAGLLLRTGLIHAWHDISTTRRIDFAGYGDVLHGRYRGRSTQAFADVGYRFDFDAVTLEPFANVAHVRVSTQGFQESGGSAALTARGGHNRQTFATLGARGELNFGLGGIATTLKGSLGWRHAFGSDTPTASFAFAGGAAFDISGVAIAKNALLVEGGLEMAIASWASLGISYTGQFSRTAQDHSGKGNLVVKF